MTTSQTFPPRSSHHAVVCINLGTPRSTRVRDVRRYLYEFLMDPYVIDLPKVLRWFLVRIIITPLRAFNSSRSYRAIWTEKGSPLLVLSEALRDQMQKRLKNPIFLAMRYGQPSIASVMEKALATLAPEGTLQIIPLYPHHAMSTTLSVFRKVQDVLATKTNAPIVKEKNIKIIFEAPFYNRPAYHKALCASLQPFIDEEGRPRGYDHILFSYHGIPARHLTKIDHSDHCMHRADCCNIANPTAHRICYRHQVFATTKNVCSALGIKEEDVSVTFQSRLGRNWLTPYTDLTIKQFPAQGIKRLLVLTPAFVSDNLETLFENAIENDELFKKEGGIELKLIPCLNVSPLWLDTLEEMIKSPSDFTETLIEADQTFRSRSAAN